MDKAHNQTDKIIKEMEKSLSVIYRRASVEIQKSWNEYLGLIKPEGEKLKKALDDAKDLTAQKKAKKEYQKFLKDKTLQDQYYRDMVDGIAKQYAEINQAALAYINGELPNIYSINYNFIGKQIDSQISGYSFSLVDAQTVKNLTIGNPTLLPTKKLNIPKDMRWNKKKINSEMLQGILQGESIPKISKRLQNVTDMNEESAKRNARTMSTSAECKARTDSQKKAIANGVILKKKWIATTDDRTRAWHLDLNEELKDENEPFVNEYGEIMYPADPTADPANVYNCRCTLGTKIIGFKPKG